MLLDMAVQIMDIETGIQEARRIYRKAHLARRAWPGRKDADQGPAQLPRLGLPSSCRGATRESRAERAKHG